ncbi:hypothetical protein GCM10027294_43870 [Marinactinospora endophytica]
MPLDSETRAVIDQLRRALARQEQEITALRRGQRGPQLAYSSLEEGQSIAVVDTTGVERGRIGWQPDGGVGLVVGGGDPPPAPTAPVVEPSLGGLRVVWDGAMDGDVAVPSDLAHVEVHVSTTPGFTPVAATRVGTITQAGTGGMLPVVPLPYTEHFVRLVGVTTGAVAGAASAEAAATPLRVDGPDLAAGSVTAGAIEAGAVTADKLQAVLVLASRIIAGSPDAARVELDETGLRGYNASGEMILAVADGSAVFSGDVTASTVAGSTITGSDIVGSSLLLGDRAADHIRIDQVLTQYELVAASASGANVWIMTSPDGATMLTSPPDEPGYGWSAGTLHGYLHRQGTDVWPATGIASPSQIGAGYAQIEMEGGTTARPDTQISYRADHHLLYRAVGSTATSGSIEIDPTLSVRAPAHQYQRVELVAQPTGSGLNGVWTDFTAAQYPRVTFRTGASGRVRITITMCGINATTGGATLAVGFRLEGPTTVGAALARSAMVRARQFVGTANTYGVQQTSTVYMQLSGYTEYTLIPAWRASGAGGTWGDAVDSQIKFDLSYDNSIVVEPLM